eukprot:scaffold272693_cov35-Tisochrysis_lutea.AAC.3
MSGKVMRPIARLVPFASDGPMRIASKPCKVALNGPALSTRMVTVTRILSSPGDPRLPLTSVSVDAPITHLTICGSAAVIIRTTPTMDVSASSVVQQSSLRLLAVRQHSNSRLAWWCAGSAAARLLRSRRRGTEWSLAGALGSSTRLDSMVSSEEAVSSVSEQESIQQILLTTTRVRQEEIKRGEREREGWRPLTQRWPARSLWRAKQQEACRKGAAR